MNSVLSERPTLRSPSISRLRPASVKPLEAWGGVECTVNRVEDHYFSQLEWNGHAQRIEDLELFAELGLKALRYPLVWELTAPNHPDQLDWSWADERLRRLRELKIRPIAGLVHHGSGPRYAPIDSPTFATGLAHFAGQVARRYPWLDAYTPVNEPLTTARFCSLYGHWYPHENNDRAFIRTLLHECQGTVLAMRAIREVNPRAELVQTDDLGRIYSTPRLQFQADFENERRWLTFDLLCGRVNRDHPMWSYLTWAGANERQVLWFEENPCPPSVMGINHYPTSDRFLDDRHEQYSLPIAQAPNGVKYVDTEAVRVMPEPLEGFEGRLREAWERFGLPLAITEAHLGCWREEQLRWLREAWQGAQNLREEGIDVRAVTVWALLGSYNWASLVTRDENHYEPGVFDLRGGTPRPTALAHLIKQLQASSQRMPFAPKRDSHPLATGDGWWRRPERIVYPLESGDGALHTPASTESELDGVTGAASGEALRQKVASLFRIQPRHAERPLLILGANGTLGSAFARICGVRHIAYYPLCHDDVDIREGSEVAAFIARLKPWAVINATGYTHVEAAEREQDLCFDINMCGATQLAGVCAGRNIALANFSSDFVFDGKKVGPYDENDAPAPLNVYGRSKREMEVQVAHLYPDALTIRTGALFSPWSGRSVISRLLCRVERGETVRAAQDVRLSPVYVPDLVHHTLDLLIDGACGLWHLVHPEPLSSVELLQELARSQGFDADLVQECTQAELGQGASQPLNRVLTSRQGHFLPPFADVLARYRSERKA